MSAQLSQLLAIVFGAGFAFLLAQRAFIRRRRSVLARRRGARAVRGEHNAEALLRARGYQILERQARRTWKLSTCLDDQASGDDGILSIDLRADLIVERGGREFIAEVKTGAAAPRLTNAATRRQLLEYRVAYPVDGVLLVDVESEQITEVEFLVGSAEPPTAETEVPASPLRWLAAGLAIGAMAGGVIATLLL